MAIIDLTQVNEAIDSPLELLKNCFHRDQLGGGGWYHQLELPRPGPTATALAIAAYRSCGRKPEHLEECLEFLRLRQVVSADPLRNGGWTNNTSMGHPVVEATGWVTWALAGSRWPHTDSAPDVEAGYRWLVANQNPDGGWGSFRGAPSRVWLACVAILGIVGASPFDPVLESAIDWLMTQRTGETGGWGQVLGATSTATHTALALYAIGTARPGWQDKRVLEAYGWLCAHLDHANIDDQHARVESYNVQSQGPNGPEIWSTSLLHYGLPWAVSAFLKHPVQPPVEDISAGVETILRSRLPVGTWPNIQGAGGHSIWALWPFIEALSSFRRSLSLMPEASAYISNGVVVLQDRNRSRQDILTLIRTPRRISVMRFFARFWPALLLMISVLVGLIVPIGIYAIQEIRNVSEGAVKHPE
jgi:hypothetical protein